MGEVYMYVKNQKSNDLTGQYQEQQQEDSQTYLNVSLQRKGRRKGRTELELLQELCPSTNTGTPFPLHRKHMNQQVLERESSLPGVHVWIAGSLKSPKLDAKCEMYMHFPRKRDLAFLSVPQKFNLPIVKRILHKEKGDPGSIPGSSTNCYVSLDESLYISGFLFLHL